MDKRLAERDVPIGGFAFQRQRYFNDAAIQKAFAETVARLPPEKRAVILRGKVDAEGGALVFAVRPFAHWTVAVITEYKKQGGWGAGFEVAGDF